MTKLRLLIFFVMMTAVVNAQQQQTKHATSDIAFSDALNKVVQDYTSNFVHIQSDKMPADVDADSYKSKVCPPAAIGCKVMRYRSSEDLSANWQAGFYEGDNFDEAVKNYKKIFALLKKTSIKGVATAAAAFDGKLETVDESIGFAVSTLRLKTSNRIFKDLVAEVEITSNFTGWEVRLNVYTKKMVEQESKEADTQ